MPAASAWRDDAVHGCWRSGSWIPVRRQSNRDVHRLVVEYLRDGRLGGACLVPQIGRAAVASVAAVASINPQMPIVAAPMRPYLSFSLFDFLSVYRACS